MEPKLIKEHWTQMVSQAEKSLGNFEIPRESAEKDELLERSKRWRQSIMANSAAITTEQYKEKVYDLARMRISDFMLTPGEEKLFDILCMYFTNSLDFETCEEGFSLKKGILLFGDIGIGKTTFMRLFCYNPRASFSLANCLEIADKYEEEGIKSLKKYFSSPAISPSMKNFFTAQSGYCFDDLGVERVVKHFGNDRNVMSTILFRRYNLECNSIFNTHLTTNLKADEIKLAYGDRVADRMREMFNILKFPADSISKRV